jgi:hypothetical protein
MTGPSRHARVNELTIAAGDRDRSSLGALALSIWCVSLVLCMIRGIGDRGESTEV